MLERRVDDDRACGRFELEDVGRVEVEVRVVKVVGVVREDILRGSC